MGRVRNVEDRRIDTKRQQSHHDNNRVNNHTTTPQYSSQRQPSIENTSIDSIVNTFRKSFI